jgi:arginine deiminase
MPVLVDNEVEALRDVVVHRPGVEIERMTQHDLHRLLFDDILSRQEAEQEHDLMVSILRGAGATAHEILDLLARALEIAPTADRERLLDRVCATAGNREIAPALSAWEPHRLAAGLVGGVAWSEVAEVSTTLSRVRAEAFDHDQMALAPVPNLMFMRDPCIAVHDTIFEGRMATHARARESVLVAFALRHTISGGTVGFESDEDHAAPRYRQIEGGDVLVLSASSVMIGCSERTSAQSIERFAREALFVAHPNLERVQVVLMPQARSVMHLDTIVTQIDRKLFLGHRPMVGEQGERALQIARIERDAPPRLLEGATVLDALREELGAEVQLVSCGGDDPMHQEREQWTDGANAVCVSPGRIILYARNRRTVAALAERGFEEVRISPDQSEETRAALIRGGLAHERTVFSFTGPELSRARGGGRCLTMPIRRETA